MTSNELRSKVTAAQEKVEKIQKTLQRHIARSKKKRAEIESLGWNVSDKWQVQGTAAHDECYWMLCDYEHILDDIIGSNKKLAEAMRISSNWIEKLEAQELREKTIATEMPEIFRQCQRDLAADWTEYDLKQRLKMETKRSELSYKEFRAIYKYNAEEALNKTEAEFRKANEQTAEAFILDLYNRVKAITGEVTNYAGIRYEGKCLNGLIEGIEGKAVVETITAGGYNIQRLHYRVLVKSL